MPDFLSVFGSGSSSFIASGSKLCLLSAVFLLPPPSLHFFVDANFDGLLRSRRVVEVRDLEARNTADVETGFSCESLTQVPSTERKVVVPRRLYSRMALTHIPLVRLRFD